MRKAFHSQMKLAPSEDKCMEIVKLKPVIQLWHQGAALCIFVHSLSSSNLCFLFAFVQCVLLNTFSCGKLTLDNKLFSNTTSL